MIKRLHYTFVLCLLGTTGFGQSFPQLQKVTADDRESEDRAGWTVDINGTTAAVGAYGDDFGATNPNMGSVYLYEQDGDGTWAFSQKIFNSDQDDYDRFGWSVDIDEDLMIVGAYGEDEDENDENSLSKAGSAYIFEREGDGTWTEVQKIVASDRAEGDEFGFSVAIHGDLIVVGAHYCSTNEVGGAFSLHAGAAYIFEQNDAGVWVELQKLVASDRWGNPGSDFDEEDWNWRYGESVGVFDDYVVVGSPFASKGYVYERSGDTWSEAEKLEYPGISWLDRAGIVAIDGTTIALGAQTWDYSEVWGEDELMNSGGAAVFDRNAGTGEWEFTQMIVNADRDAGDHFGIDIDIAGDYIVVGTHSDNHDEEDAAYLENAGSAYVFKLTDGTWAEYDKMDASDRAEEDEFGIAVSISGATAIVGAFQQDYPSGGGEYIEDAGAAYFFTDSEDEGCPPVYSSQAPTICDGESFTVGASTYTETGTYTDVLTSVDGCDSIVTTNLTVLGADPFEYEETICEGQEVVVGESTYTEAGTYTDVFETDAGCDSVVITTVIVTDGIDDNVVSGDEFGLFTFAEGIVSYQWIRCDPYEEIPGENFWFFVPPGDGEYAVIVESEGGCIDTSDCVTIGDGGGPGDELTLPSSGSGPVQSECEGTLFDSGGSADPYGNSEDSDITISPTGATAVEIEFIEFDIEGGPGGSCNFDWLKVYDGPSTASPLIGEYCNSAPPPATINSTGGSITIEFHSDEVVNHEGFEIEWTCLTGGSGIDELLKENTVEVYPNPNNGNFMVAFNEVQNTSIQAEVINELGQTIHTQILTGTNNEVELNNATPGIYLLRLSNENEQIYKKIIIR